MHLKRVVVQVDWTRFGFVVFGIVRFAEFALKIAVYQSVLVVAVGDIAAVVEPIPPNVGGWAICSPSIESGEG